MRLPRLFFKLNRLAGLEGENTDMEGTLIGPRGVTRTNSVTLARSLGSRVKTRKNGRKEKGER